MEGCCEYYDSVYKKKYKSMVQYVAPENKTKPPPAGRGNGTHARRTKQKQAVIYKRL